MTLDAAQKNSEVPAVRWDRRLNRAIAASDDGSRLDVGVLSVDANEVPLDKEKSRLPMASWMKRLVKRPLIRLRALASGSVLAHLDAAKVTLTGIREQNIRTQQTLGYLHTKLDAAIEDISSRADIAEQSANQRNELLVKLQDHIRLLEQQIGFLHVKADEGAVKTRPLVALEGAFAVPLADGYILLPEHEEELVLMYTGAGAAGLEPGTRRVLQTISTPGGHVIDVGASVGLHTIALARAIGPQGRIDAFEAEPRLIPYIKRTLASNGLLQVNLHNRAVGSEDGETIFNVAKTIGHSSLFQLSDESEVQEQIQVPILRLDSAIPAGTKIDLIKMDVEGAEIDVLKGSARILAESPNCMIVAECGPSHLRRIGIDINEWFKAFEAFGFDFYTIREPDGLLDRLTIDQVAMQFSLNILFFRSSSNEDRRFRKLLCPL